MVLPTCANGTDAWRGQARNCVLCCVYSRSDLHLSCNEVVPQSTQEKLEQKEVLGRTAGEAWPLCRCQVWTGSLPGCLSAGRRDSFEAPCTPPASQKEAKLRKEGGPPGSQCFLQQPVPWHPLAGRWAVTHVTGQHTELQVGKSSTHLCLLCACGENSSALLCVHGAPTYIKGSPSAQRKEGTETCLFNCKCFRVSLRASRKCFVLEEAVAI